MPPPATVLPARLATGDWVVLARADAGPLGFLGKVTDGEWDPRDDALLRARVETTRSKPLWFAAGDLERVEPSDEAALVELALERGLVPDDRAARLRADLAAVRDRTLTFVRSPGLLDRLWAALPIDPEQRGAGGLVALFDEGQRALVDARYRRRHLAPPRSPPGVDVPPPPLPEDFEIDVPGEPTPIASTRPPTRREAVARILAALPVGSLRGLLGRLERGDLRATPPDAIAAALLADQLPLPTLLEALAPRRLREVPPVLGLPHVPGLADRTIRAWVLATFRDPGSSPTPVPEELIPLPTWREPLLPRSEVEARWRVLGLVRGRELPEVCERAGVTLSDGRRSALELCLAIATSTRRDLKRLLFALPSQALVHAPWALGLPPIVGARDHVVDELAGRWPPSPGPTPALGVGDPLLPHVVRALSLAELTLVLLKLRSPAPVEPTALVHALRAAGHGVRDVLSHLGPGALSRVATAFGVPTDVDGPERLHAAILSFEPSPFA